ncbi:MAG: glycine--tRNA ligase subunit beta [Alphaproteobacteria bacterium]|nr:glycine--tRNA ligase subunit beta [Alphaproteobacteria bacterium]
MNELLIEFYSEEIPARMQCQAEKDSKVLLESILTAQNASFQTVQSFIAPQRLTLCVSGLDEATKDIKESRRGPKVDAPVAAFQGFLKSVGQNQDQLIQKDGHWYADLAEPGKLLVEILPEVIGEFLDKMPWPKSMQWHNHQTNKRSKPWIRPLHSIVCVYQGRAVSFNISSLGLTTGNVTYGHRFLAPDAIMVTDFRDYQEKLAEAFVVVDRQDRQRDIYDRLGQMAAEKGLFIKDDPALLDEVSGLVDFPFVHIGRIEKEFMRLPDVVLSTSMRVHQKYFTLCDRHGKIAPFFGVVTNNPGGDGQLMMAGFERVLRARLADASFFYDVDLKSPLESLVPKLDAIIFHIKLGSLGQKVERLCRLMTTDDGARAALLCKMDLLTQMVGEFPELQGTMGQIYAILQGESDAVAAAIKEHYQPHGPTDDCPTAPISMELALADKIDTLVGFLGSGIKPTGSKDPLGLRRAALGVIRIIIENTQKEVCLRDLIHRSVCTYQNQSVALSAGVADDAIQFIADRLSFYLKGQGGDHDCVMAILSTQSGDIRPYSLWSIAERAKALQALLQTDAGESLKGAYRRAAGILAKESHDLPECDEALLVESAEKDLFVQIQRVQQDYRGLLENHDYAPLMELLATLRPQIDAFFDAVMVNCEDQTLKNNRCALLSSFKGLVDQIADFSKLQG